ncbi:MAG: recombinase family protein [Flavobacterium sp.]|nr:MAG: recombinase family protein [Flavobacterium sp.]
MTTIIYTRVSTDEQAEKGFSLRHQKQLLTTYCELNKLTIAKHYEDDYSAKNFDRPEWKNLMEYVAKNRKTVDKILFTKWDRFSRNAEQALAVIRKLTAMGIEVNSIEQPLDLTNPDNKVMLSMYLILPEVENDKISQRTKDGMRRATKEGCFLAKAPYGYSNGKVLGKTSVIPNNDSAIVLAAYTEVAKGVEAVEVIRKRFKTERGLTLQKQQFYNMLRNKLYCGWIEVPEFKKEAASKLKGIHEPLVSQELFDKVQDVLDGRKNIGAKLPSTVNENFPLKGSLICPVCEKQITASKSKGNGGHYEYYHCTAKCKVRYKKEVLHENVAQMLTKISLNKNVADLYKEVLSDLISQSEDDTARRRKELVGEKESLEKLVIDAEDRLMKNELKAELFDRITTRYEASIREIEASIGQLERNDLNLGKYVEDSVKLLCDMGGLFNQLKDSKKGGLLRTIFPENLVVEKEGLRTNSTNTVLELLSREYRGLEKAKMKKATKNSGFSNVAPPLGLEPRTL